MCREAGVKPVTLPLQTQGVRSSHRQHEGPQRPTCVVLVALSGAGEELRHGGAHALRGASQVLSTLF